MRHQRWCYLTGRRPIGTRSSSSAATTQTGAGYVVHGTQVVTAPATTTVLCSTGNTAEVAYAVADPPGAGVAGCATWTEWVTQGSNYYYYGKGNAQCDSGRYAVRIQCRNVQTGQVYVVESYAVTAPATVSTYCYTGNTAETVQAVPA